MNSINKYNNGKIYRLYSFYDGIPDVYYGSTTHNLARRLSNHRSAYKQYKSGNGPFYSLFNLFDKHGMDKFSIQLIENFSCDNRNELDRREAYYIKNNQCVNKNIAGRTRREYYKDNFEIHSIKMKKWYSENRDKHLQNIKKYNEDHKAHISEYQKKYRNANREKAKLYQKQYRLKTKKEKEKKPEFKCKCGAEYTIENKTILNLKD